MKQITPSDDLHRKTMHVVDEQIKRLARAISDNPQANLDVRARESAKLIARIHDAMPGLPNAAASRRFAIGVMRACQS